MTLRFDGAWLGERRCFTEAHFSTLVRKYRDSRLVTRAIFVGEFLSQLREAGLDPLLKGGSSLMFLLKDLRRLSEDVDIALADEAELEAALASTGKNLPGFQYAREKRKGVHFRLSHPALEGEYVLLDAVSPEPGYPARRVRLSSEVYASPASARMPTIPSMMGDKLTTLGRRIGIEHGRRPPVEHVKQLYDLHILLGHISDAKEVALPHRKTVAFQCSYRGVRCAPEEALDDLADELRAFMMTPATVAVPHARRETVTTLRLGIRQFQQYLERSARFEESQARLAAARVLCFSRLLRDKVADVQAVLARAHGADAGTIERAARIVREHEGELSSNELRRGATEAMVLLAAYHEPGLLLS